MFVLIECNSDRLSILKELAGRVYGTRVVCTSPDLATLPDRIEYAVIVDAKNRAASAQGMKPLAGFDLADWLEQAEAAELDGVPGAIVPIQHDLYTDADQDRPKAICDQNGQVVLGMCKRCRRAESELDQPCTVPPPSEDDDEPNDRDATPIVVRS